MHIAIENGNIGARMSQVGNSTLPYHMAIPLGAFLLSRAPRLAKHFPGASIGGLALSAAAGSISVALGMGRALAGSSEDRLNRFLETTILMILGNLSALVVSKSLKGCVSLSFSATVKLIALEGVCNGILTIALHSDTQAEPILQAPEAPEAPIEKIASLSTDVFNHMLLNLRDPETILYARLSFAKKLEEEGSPINKEGFIREPRFWRLYFSHHFSSVTQLRENNEEVCKKVCYLTRQFFGGLLNTDERVGLAIRHGCGKLLSRELPNIDVNRRFFCFRFYLRGVTLLNYAILHGHEESFLELLKALASIDVTDDERRTPLHIAVKYGSVENVQLLLGAQASVDVTDNMGETVLHYAARRHSPENVQALLDAQVSVDVTDDERRTPLHIAVKYGSVENVQLLLGAQASVDVTDNMGETVLHYAARRHSPENVQALLDAQASVEATDHLGRTPLDYAQTQEIRDLLDYNAELKGSYCILQ